MPLYSEYHYSKNNNIPAIKLIQKIQTRQRERVCVCVNLWMWMSLFKQPAGKNNNLSEFPEMFVWVVFAWEKTEECDKEWFWCQYRFFLLLHKMHKMLLIDIISQVPGSNYQYLLKPFIKDYLQAFLYI